MTTINDALEYTGFGKYSIFLIFISFFVIIFKFACINVMHYSLPYAICDLEIDSLTQGAINASFYFGDALFSFFWAIASDRVGRKKILLIINSISLITAIFLTFSPTGAVLAVANCILGITSGNAITTIVVVLCEFHKESYRTSLTVLTGFCYSLSCLIISGTAIGIIPLKFSYPMASVKFSSWRLFILISLVISGLIALLMEAFCYETPKFLMYNSGPEAALKVLKKVYAWNTGKDGASFPVTVLEFDHDFKIEEKQSQSFKGTFILIWRFFKRLFEKSLRKQVLILMFFFFLDGLWHTINSWSPQYYALYSSYNSIYGKGLEQTFCSLVVAMDNSTTFDSEDLACNNVEIKNDRFMMTIYYGIGTACITLIESILTNNIVSNTNIIIVTFFIQIICVITLLSVPFSVISLNLINILQFGNFFLLLSFSTELFPTTIRAFGICFLTCISSLSAFLGNLVLPLMLIICCYCVMGFLIILGIAQFITMLIIKKILKPVHD